MTLKINDTVFDYFNRVWVSLHYDSVASTFAFEAYFNPDNDAHKVLFKPSSYQRVTIEHNGELLITGTLLNITLKDEAQKQLVNISGYSITGVLEDCEIPTSVFPLQSNGVSLKHVTEKIIGKFGLKLVVDSSATDDVNANYRVITGRHTQTVKQFLAMMANQRGVFMTHDEKGNLVYRKDNTNLAPIYHFDTNTIGVKYELQVDGQKMHDTITVIRQQLKSDGNITQESVSNPYVPVLRPSLIMQTCGDNSYTKKTARNILSEQLQAIKLKIELDRWDINGKIIRPNTMITIENKNLYIYKKTLFFVETVDFTGDKNSQRATLLCTVPEVFNHNTPVNMFK